MDDVIFEEFKGTGNMEIHLDRKLMDKRVFPAIDISRNLAPARKNCCCREEELNRVVGAAPGAQPRCHRSRALELLIDKLSKTRSNAEFLAAMSG